MLTLVRNLRSVIVAGTSLRADLEQVGAAGKRRLVAHPDQARLELVGIFGRLAGMRQHVAARDVDLAVEHQRHRLPGDRFGRGRRPW